VGITHQNQLIIKLMSYPSPREQLSDPQSPSDVFKPREALRMVIEEWKQQRDCCQPEGLPPGGPSCRHG
jgi:hypothetical protein